MKLKTIFAASLMAQLLGCAEKPVDTAASAAEKPVIYQVLPRLYGNTNPTNKPWGTLEENGVGRFNHFTPERLAQIRALGANHIWYTGVLHHALVGDYTEYGIGNDDPDVVKGRAGSPYAIKDYYSVNPDLAEKPAQRLQEFRALVQRSHAQDLKVIIDIVPNHVARAYQSLHKPEGVRDFGADDDSGVSYARDNNFYYAIGEDFKVPQPVDGYRPLGGEAHPLADGLFHESPAKWTGNGARAAQPAHDDWYETVKINFGVRPDGGTDFPELSAEFAHRDYREHAAFWADKEVPDSWKKFRDIAHYWLDFGVDGFRYDMAGMVPVEFWSYLNSSIKMRKPDALLLAEIYEPEHYRDYIHLGKMDYLYDKVDTYDTLRDIIEGKSSTDPLADIQQRFADIAPHLLLFMENHDEQRIASPQFAGNPLKGKPPMLVSATVSAAPLLVYFGQELGEPALEDAGFGRASRTTIFDYWSVPSVRRWLEGESTAEELELRNFYQRLMNFSAGSSALRGNYADLHRHNRESGAGYSEKQFAYARWSGDERLLVIASFEDAETAFTLRLPQSLVKEWELADGRYPLMDQLDSSVDGELEVRDGAGKVALKLPAQGGRILRIANFHPNRR